METFYKFLLEAGFSFCTALSQGLSSMCFVGISLQAGDRCRFNSLDSFQVGPSVVLEQTFSWSGA